MYSAPDPSLPEAIVVLQRLELPGDTRRLVEEAAQLLGDGREIEARALVEKAQALANAALPAVTNGAPRPAVPKTLEETGFPPLAARLAAPIAAAIANALVELQRYTAGEIGVLARSADERLLQVLREIGGIKLSHDVLAARVDRVDRRVTVCEDQFAAVDQVVAGLAAGIAAFNTRLDEQTGLLRGMQERHARRTAVLNDVLGNLAKLREHHDPETDSPQAQAATGI